MEIKFTGKNLKISGTAKSYLQRKLGKIIPTLPTVLETSVEITKQKAKDPDRRYRIQVTIDSNGTLLRGDETASTLYDAINSVVDVIGRQAERYRSKVYFKYKQRKAQKTLSPKRAAAEAATEERTPEELPEGVVRIKSFEIKPMSVSEARDQMELLGHDFFLFLNDESEEFNLLYRRKDGHFGLIEPRLPR